MVEVVVKVKLLLPNGQGSERKKEIVSKNEREKARELGRKREREIKETTSPMLEVVVKVKLLLPDGRTSGREVEKSF